MKSLATLCAVLSAVWSAQAAQVPLSYLEPTTQAVSPSTPAPSVLSHAGFPAHKLRVHHPKPSLCESSGPRSWSGYLDVDVDKLLSHRNGSASSSSSTSASKTHGITEHMYFWAFESRNDPVNDPIVLWINGGPGCSSISAGLLMELGPCSIAEGGKGTTLNPYAWNNNATIVFLDQPVGVGFSYSDWTHPDKHNKTEKIPGRSRDTPGAAIDTSAFLHLLALHATDVFGNKTHHSGISSFHIAGESYAGRYLPLIANQIIKDNEEAQKHPERGIRPLPLQSLLIGNGFVSPRHQYPAYADYICKNNHGWGQFVSDEECKQMYEDVPTCLALTDKCNAAGPNEPYDVLACRLAEEYCEDKLGSAYGRTGRSPYDFNHKGDYKEEAWISKFIDKPEVRKQLGVDARIGDHHDGKFSSCSSAVFNAFEKTGDGARTSVWAVEELLKQNIRVLVYEGTYDWICNYEGAYAWTLDMNWSGAEKYRAEKKHNWYVWTAGVKGDLAGRYKTSDNFTYAEVDAAGHFVPHDQPRAALSMFNFWLHGATKGELRP